MTSQPVSCDAFTAPAWIDFQNSCVVPLGMTAMVFFPDDPPEAAGAVVAPPPEEAVPEVEDLSSHETAAKRNSVQKINCVARIMR